MPDLDAYRAELPDLSDEELEQLRWTLRGLARAVVDAHADRNLSQKSEDPG